MRQQKIDLHSYTSIGIGPKVDVLLPESEEDLFSFSEQKIIGNGTNLLIDENFNSNLICMNHLDSLEINENLIYAESGVLLSRLIGTCIRKGLNGLSSLAGIPGSIGGLIYMNAGNIGKNSSLKKIRCFTKEKGVYDIDVPREKFSYRKSPFSDDVIIVGAFFEMKKSYGERVFEDVKKAILNKKQTQPIFEKSFGSVFKNPESVSAWKLIERCGLKGKEKGDAMISRKHCNFIVNRGNASFSDVMYLIELCMEKVYNEFSIMLEKEVVVLRGLNR